MTRALLPEERALVTTSAALVALPHNHTGTHAEYVMRLDRLVASIDRLSAGAESSEARKNYALIHDGDCAMILHQCREVLAIYFDRPETPGRRHYVIADLAREIATYFKARSAEALAKIGIEVDAE